MANPSSINAGQGWSSPAKYPARLRPTRRAERALYRFQRVFAEAIRTCACICHIQGIPARRLKSASWAGVVGERLAIAAHSKADFISP
jgi:hypothetical protein